MVWYIKHKTLNTVIQNYLNNKRYFECEIKTTTRWQQVTVNKWFIVTEPTHLNQNIWIISSKARKHCHVAQRHKTAVAVFGIFFVGKMEQKQEIWCLKRKSLNINLLFIELLFKINIIFVIILIFEETNGTLCVILTKWNDRNIYILCPHILNFVIILNVF